MTHIEWGSDFRRGVLVSRAALMKIGRERSDEPDRPNPHLGHGAVVLIVGHLGRKLRPYLHTSGEGGPSIGGERGRLARPRHGQGSARCLHRAGRKGQIVTR